MEQPVEKAAPDSSEAVTNETDHSSGSYPPTDLSGATDSSGESVLSKATASAEAPPEVSDEAPQSAEPAVELPTVGEVIYCRRCQEPLSFFSTGPWHCWKCSLEFDPRRPRTYVRRRTLLKWKFWWPGFCLSVSCGMLAFSLLVHTGQMVVPGVAASAVILGNLLGYGAPVRVRVYVALAVSLVCMLLATIFTGSPLGLILGFMGSLILLAPFGVGALAGVILRVVLENSSWDQRWYFP